MAALNDTDVEMYRWNLDVPRYLYKEIPLICEVLGTILNVIVIINFLKSKRYLTPVFTILTCLAAMDTCVCLGGAMYFVVFPTVISSDAGFTCSLSVFISMTGLVGSEYHLIFFSGVRCYQAMSPLKARASVTVGLMVKCCAIIVLVSISSSLAYAAFLRPVATVIDGDEITVCIFLGDSYSKDLAYMIFLAAIPCVSIFLIHLLKYFAYIKSKSLVKGQQERKSPDARIAATVIALFYISWGPPLTYVIIQHVSTEGYSFAADNLYLVLLHVMHANSILNPLVYVLAMKSIRDEVINLFCFTSKNTPP